MFTLLRHLLAIAILPFTVVVLVPFWIAERFGVALTLGRSVGSVLLQVVGFALLSLGLLLFVASLRRFATDGKGTLAPWDPPNKFVVRGPYQFVRNPMISGVILLLFGEALVLLSRSHGIWAVCFLLLNLIYIPIIEEPQLERRFGNSYQMHRSWCGLHVAGIFTCGCRSIPKRQRRGIGLFPNKPVSSPPRRVWNCFQRAFLIQL